MKKHNDQRWQPVLLATIAVTFLFYATTLTFAQDAAKFKVGDRIKYPRHDAPATIVKIEPGWLFVKWPDTDGIYEIMMSSDEIILLGANGKPVVGKKAAPTKETELARNNGEAKTGMTAAPGLECSFDAPTGTVSKTSAPSAQLFKRVIYERMAESVKAQYGAKVRFGLQFTTFQMGTPFKNVMSGRGLLKDSVPENAMFYPIQTQFKECREVVNGDSNRYRVTKMNFGCYQDRFGDWVCGTDSTPEFLDQQDVLKNQ